VEWEIAGKTEVRGESWPSAILSTTNSIWLDLGSKLGHRGGKPATNCLSYGTAWKLYACGSCGNDSRVSVNPARDRDQWRDLLSAVLNHQDFMAAGVCVHRNVRTISPCREGIQAAYSVQWLQSPADFIVGQLAFRKTNSGSLGVHSFL
jgi:hypothetical protein